MKPFHLLPLALLILTALLVLACNNAPARSRSTSTHSNRRWQQSSTFSRDFVPLHDTSVPILHVFPGFRALS